MSHQETMLIFTPLHNEPPNNNYAVLDLRNNHPVLDFRDNAEDDATFTAVLPRSYTSLGLRVFIYFAMSTADEGDVKWTGKIERIGETQIIDTDGYASPQSVIQEVAGFNGYCARAQIAFSNGTQMDNLVAGEPFRLQVSRDADDVLDTATGDAELLTVEIMEQ